MKCYSLNEWITNNTSTRTIVFPQHQINTSRRPGHQNVPCGFQTYLGRKELRREKENKRQQDKTFASGGKYRSREEISRNTQAPSLKGKLFWTERKQGKTAAEI